MGYLSMHSDEPSKMVLMIIMLFGLFECQVLPQGVKQVTDIFQCWMSSLFSHLKRNAPNISLDDVLHTCGNSFDDHIKYLKTILKVLEKAGMQVNAKKCTWCAMALEFLGFWVTGGGDQPFKSWVEAILAIVLPTNVKQVQMFVGCINFFMNHIPKWSEIVEPSKTLTKKGLKILWGIKQWEAFMKIKADISNSIMLAYTDINCPFIQYTDSSDTQLWGLLLQVDLNTKEEKTISSFSQRLNPAQISYSVMEKELLSIVESLKHFHNIKIFVTKIQNTPANESFVSSFSFLNNMGPK